MRVLRVDDLRFKEFPDLPDKPYAILSHVWGEREITFQDLTRYRFSDLKRKPGLEKAAAKLQGYRSLAQKSGIEYIWIDTCCINKPDHSELTEAINSMYNWYKVSEVCYAYLEDVKWKDSESGKLEFPRSKWFTRGWTLQELLATKDVVFFSRNWKKLGNKRGLSRIVSSTTNIHRDYLRGEKAVEDASVAQRMSWASERQTSKVEVLAYCLMGIFNVKMPLLYGERLPGAFRRLQEEILKVHDDTSIFAWNNMSSDICGGLGSLTEGAVFALLAPSPACFRDSNEIVRKPIPSGHRYKNFVRGVRAPIIFNNKGLHLTLPVIVECDNSDGRRHVRAVLGCSLIGSTAERVTILLVDICADWRPEHA